MATRREVEVWFTEDEVANLLECIDLAEVSCVLSVHDELAREKLNTALEELENN